jgi:hypothetical protein
MMVVWRIGLVLAALAVAATMFWVSAQIMPPQ